MQYFVSTDSLPLQQTDCIAVGVFEGQQLSPAAEQLDQTSQNSLKKILQRGDHSGKPGQLLLIQDIQGVTSPRILLVGCGQFEKTTENDFNTATTAMAKWLNDSAVKAAISCLADVPVKQRSVEWKVRQTVANTETALYRYSQTKSLFKPAEHPLEALTVIADEATKVTLEKACTTGAAVGRGMNLARELAIYRQTYVPPPTSQNRLSNLAKPTITCKSMCLKKPIWPNWAWALCSRYHVAVANRQN